MDRGVTAIPTRYAGCRMRSRIEARWAVFLDTLGLRWEYEREGYDLGGVRYLPDFWLPSQRGFDRPGCWIEIRGRKPTNEEDEKARLLAKATQSDVFVFFGGIPDVVNGSVLQGDLDSAHFHSAHGLDNCYQWCECTTCSMIGLEFDGRADRLACKQCQYCVMRSDPSWSRSPASQQPCPVHGDAIDLSGCPRAGGNLDKGYAMDTPRLNAAYAAARFARFEFGEQGRWT